MPDESPATGDSAGLSQTPAGPSPAAAPPPSSPETTGGEQATGGLPPPSPDTSILGVQQPPAPVDWINPDGTFKAEFATKLPEEFGDARSKYAHYKSVPDVFKALHNANQALGKKGVIIPTEKSPPEEVAAYRKAMGVPDTPGDYAKMIIPEDVPEGLEWNDDIAAPYLEIAHRHNIPPQALKELAAMQLRQKQFEQEAETVGIQETKTQGLAQLRRIWGGDFQRNLGVAEKAVKMVNGDTNSYGFRDPEVVRIVVGLASMLDEDQLVGPGGALPAGVHDMRARAFDIMTNPSNPEYQKYHGQDRDVQAKVRRWIKDSEPAPQRR